MKTVNTENGWYIARFKEVGDDRIVLNDPGPWLIEDNNCGG